MSEAGGKLSEQLQNARAELDAAYEDAVTNHNGHETTRWRRANARVNEIIQQMSLPQRLWHGYVR